MVASDREAATTTDTLAKVAVLVAEGEAVVLCQPRGIGDTKWTRKDGPNYVERSHALLGRTVDAGRVWDVIAAAKYLAGSSRLSSDNSQPPVTVGGGDAAGLIAAYAAVLDEQIAGVLLVAPQRTHMDSAAPQLLNVLRVCDAPTALGLIAPRPLTLAGVKTDDFAATKAAYAAAGAVEKLTFK